MQHPFNCLQGPHTRVISWNSQKKKSNGDKSGGLIGEVIGSPLSIHRDDNFQAAVTAPFADDKFPPPLLVQYATLHPDRPKAAGQ
ncbi:hypothetical protein TNCV_931141 [Trichonephila clavipes]|uniref:Uncharacterized protein n=1 Tax=Trichonephila clavipes TaxID=2585209 RepID=A0A8X7BD09_TRICX|nr:hypothetical protein TNCV_931141 [Trichonephila clavipes]